MVLKNLIHKGKIYINFINIFSCILLISFNLILYFNFSNVLFKDFILIALIFYILKKLLVLMFILAIKHDDIKDSETLFKRIIYSLLPFGFILSEIGIIVFDIYMQSSLGKRMFDANVSVFEAYRSYHLRDYFNYLNAQYREYCRLERSGQRDLNEDLSNVITKVRRDRDPERTLTLTDIFAVKRMGSIEGYNNEISRVLKGLSNGDSIGRRNYPTYSWASRSGPWRQVANELELVNNINIAEKQTRTIRARMRIENVLN